MLNAPDTPTATCEISELGTCVQLTARGEFDVGTVAVLQDAAAGLYLAPGRVVLLDLSGATLAGAAVIHFAVGLHHRAAAHGSELVVLARPRTRELFALAGADEVTIVEDPGDVAATGPAS